MVGRFWGESSVVVLLVGVGSVVSVVSLYGGRISGRKGWLYRGLVVYTQWSGTRGAGVREYGGWCGGRGLVRVG